MISTSHADDVSKQVSEYISNIIFNIMPGKIDPKELAIYQDEMDLVYRFYWGIPSIQMCRNMIRQHLFSNVI